MGAIIERDYAAYPKLMGRLSQYHFGGPTGGNWACLIGRMAQQSFVRATKKWRAARIRLDAGLCAYSFFCRVARAGFLV